MQMVDALARRLAHPAERLRNSRRNLAHLAARLSAAMKHEFSRFQSLIEKHEAVLAGLDHQTVLARGYSLTMNERREIVRNPSMVAVGERVVTTLAAGEIESEVKKKG